MAVRLYSEFKSDRGDQYKIEIHDTQWLAVPTEFNVDSRGFELTYEGETDDIVSPIVSSRLTFGAYAANGTFETFIDTLKLFQENRFRVVVYRASTSDVISDFESRVYTDGGTIEDIGCLRDAVAELGLGAYELFWVGWVTQDLVSVEDASAPYVYEITATDGIGRLANVEYDEPNGVIETNGLQVTRVTDVLKNTLTNIGTSDLWGANDVFFETAVDWWETNAQTYSTSVDPALNQGFDVRYFNERDDNGDVVYPPTLEILRQMATLYNARIFMQRGRFVFEQYGNRDAASRYVSRYTKTGTAISRTAINDDVAVDQTTFAARRSGNNWNFLPAAQATKIHYVQRFLNPFNAFSQFRFRNSPNAFTAGFIAGGSGVQLAFGSTPFNFRVVGAPSVTSPVFPVFKMRIRIKDSSTGTFYYCNRAYLGVATGGAMFGIPAWSTTADEYFFDMPAFFTSGVAVVASNVQIITPDIPVNGEIDFQLQHHGVFRSSNGSTYTPTQTPLFDGTFVFAINTNGATNSPGATFSSTNAEVGIDSKLTIDLGDVVIADGPFQSGHLAAYNGSAWTGTQDWRKGSSGTALPILKLLSNETLALHVRPIEQYNGNIISSSLFGQRLTFDSTAYLMTSGTFTANTDEWSGTWYKIQTIRTAVTALDELPDLLDRLPLTSATTSGVSPNDIIGGRIAGMVVDIENEKVGPFEQTASGGKIDGTLDVVGDAVFDSNVQVDGDTTIVGTIDVTDLEVSNDLDVAGSTTLGGLSAGTTTLGASTIASASVTGNTSVGGTLGVTGTATLGTLNAGVSTLGASTLASASVTGNTSVGGTLGVTGTSTLGTLNAGTSTLSSAAVTGAATIGGTLGVTGTSTLGTLNAGASTLASSAVTGNQTIGGTLGVTGTATLGTLNAAATSVTTLAASSNTTIGGTLGVTGASTLGTLNAGASTLGSASVTGNTSVGGTLGVTGTATLGTLNAAATSVTTLAAASNTTIGGTLGVTGASTLGTLNAAATSVSTLAASSNATIGGTLGVTGTSTLGTLNAGTSTLGASTLSSAAVTGNQTIGGTLGVTGASTLGTLNAGTTTLGASTIGSATITGDASVGGSTTLANVTANDVTAADVVLDNVVSKTAVIGTTGLVDAFRTRVLADGGTFEAFDEVVTAVTELLAGGSNKSAVIYGETNVEALAASGAVTMASTLDVDGRTATSYLQLDTAFVPNGEPAGALYWDPDGAIAAVRGIDGISLDLNEKEVWFVKNQSGAAIGAGVAVYASGTLGSSGQLLIGKMIADGTINAKYFLGITQANIDNGGDGYVVRNGKIRQIDTSTFAEGDVLYVSPSTAGALTATEPTAPNLKLPTAFVIKASATGTIAVRQTPGSYLAESHDVQIDSPAENELLARTSSGRWENVELGAVLTTTTEKPESETSESFTAAFGTNSGTIMGEPAKWLPITIGGVNYLMPLYAAP